MSVSTTFDLLLRGGRVIDPASGIDGLKDVAIRNGKIHIKADGGIIRINCILVFPKIEKGIPFFVP